MKMGVARLAATLPSPAASVNLPAAMETVPAAVDPAVGVNVAR